MLTLEHTGREFCEWTARLVIPFLDNELVVCESTPSKALEELAHGLVCEIFDTWAIYAIKDPANDRETLARLAKNLGKAMLSGFRVCTWRTGTSMCFNEEVITPAEYLLSCEELPNYIRAQKTDSGSHAVISFGYHFHAPRESRPMLSIAMDNLYVYAEADTVLGLAAQVHSAFCQHMLDRLAMNQESI